ncbi:MAG: leucine-rich repeat domain-containing protein [Leptospiraceae bacterium]|nr:leucine-rich repeat domain-containing protein [Leptospiraceae bacterium]
MSDDLGIIGELKKLGYRCLKVSYEDFLEKRQYTKYKGIRYVLDESQNVIGLKFYVSSYPDAPKIPKQIWEFKNVKWLFLNSITLKEVPKWITNFQKLEVLDLSSNELKKLPEFLTKLKNLVDLNISSNSSLKHLPEFIGSFPNLQILNLKYINITKLPNTISRLTKLIELDLSENGLEGIPEPVCKLTNLKKLNLSGIILSELPKNIGKLKNLIELDLSFSKLKTVPESIGSLPNLQKLNLSLNEIEKIHEGIFKLTKLTNLDLSMTGLTEIPEPICNLHSLIELNLSSNEITSVPNYIGKMKNLSILNLESNKIKKISNSIGKLTSLMELDASYNELDSLPSSIGKLRNLKKLTLSTNIIHDITVLAELDNLEELNLSDNQIKEFPETFCSLTNLRELNLSENQIKEFPETFCALTNLRELYLSDNKIEKVPDPIGNLQNLSYLDLSTNELTSIPNSIGELINLASLTLNRNKILFLPESILKLENLESIDLQDNLLPLDRSELNINVQELLEYYFGKIKQKESVYDYRILILGESRVGKTRLIERLVHKEFHEGSTTDGLETRTWTISLPEDKKTTVRLNLWDFGGQEIYHSTHKFFLLENSLYMFLWNANKGDKENDFEYWLNTIENYGGSSPILFVISQIDTKVMELNYKELKERFPQIIGFYKVSSKTGEGIPELEKAIRESVSKNRAHWENAKWEQNWLRIKDELISIPEYRVSYEKEFLEICKKYNVQETEAKKLIEFLHYSGHVLYFSNSENSNLKNSIILNREQITSPIYNILDVEKIKSQRGIVYKSDFYTVIKEDKKKNEFLVDLVLDIMFEFNLCFELEKDKYLVPKLLSIESVDYDWDNTNNLQIEYHYNFLPPDLMEKLIVELKDDILKLENKSYACWRGGMYLQRQDSFGYIAYKKYERKIMMKVSGKDIREKQELLTILRNELDKVCDSYAKLEIQTKVPCICSPNCDYRFPYEFLRRLEREKEFHTHCQRSGKKIDIAKLLNGIESQEKREKENFIFIQNQTNIGEQTNFNQNTQINIYNFFGDFNNIKNDTGMSEIEREKKLYEKMDEFDEKIKDINHYEKIIKERHRLSFFEHLSRKSQTYLISAEFLLDEIRKIEGLDYSPAILQYNRTIENELKLELFNSFHSYFNNQSAKLEPLLQQDKYTNSENKVFVNFLRSKIGGIVSLGFMVTVLNNATKLQDSELLMVFYSFLEKKIALDFLYSDVLGKLQIALKYRNDAAHPGTLYKHKDAENCQSLTLDILDKLLKSYKRNMKNNIDNSF